MFVVPKGTTYLCDPFLVTQLFTEMAGGMALLFNFLTG
jgi:hypothetical protein